jgi:predicted TIM-barrel fold metal-dependent hydrolase
MPEAPACLAPGRTRAPRFTMPDGACDSHAHVIGAPPDYPFVAARSYTPPEATEQAYLRHLDALGCARGVLVQVSVHGSDNRRMVEAVKAHPDRLRGVAVLPPDIDGATLESLHEDGVRAVRVNVLFGGGIGFDAIEPLAERIAPLGWHLELLLDARSLPELAPRLAKLQVPFVIDHMGHAPYGNEGFATMIALLRDGAWVKLSGAYRIASPRYDAVKPIAQACLDAAPDRCVWGSDWPHVALTRDMPNAGALLDLLADWAPEPALRNRVLVDNPARLYRFG